MLFRSAIRYPRGRGNIFNWQEKFTKIDIGKAEIYNKGTMIAVLTIGTIFQNTLQAIESFATKNEIGLYNMRFVKPLDKELLHQVFQKYQTIITVEDGAVKGGFGGAIAEFMAAHSYANKLEIVGIPDQFFEHATINELQDKAGISSDKISDVIKKYL